MFDKMKQVYELQKKAREIKNKLESVRIEKIDSGVKIVVNGLYKVEELTIDPALLTQDKKAFLEKTLSRLFSNAVEEIQKKSAAESQDLLKGFSF